MIIDLDQIFYLWKCDINITEEIKKILEEKQRNKFKDLEYKKEEYKPKYLKKEKNELSNDEVYVYCRDYYEERKKGNFGEMPNLFEYKVKCCFCFFWCFKNKKELKKNKKKNII